MPWSQQLTARVAGSQAVEHWASNWKVTGLKTWADKVKNLSVPLSEALNPRVLQRHHITMADPVKQHLSLHTSYLYFIIPSAMWLLWMLFSMYASQHSFYLMCFLQSYWMFVFISNIQVLRLVRNGVQCSSYATLALFQQSSCASSVGGAPSCGRSE